MDSDVDLRKTFGLTKIVADDTHWTWYLDEDNYAPILPHFGLDKANYLDLWDEIMKVFPLEWAKQTHSRLKGSYAWMGFHPPVLGRLNYHPVATFLAKRPYGWTTLAPLLRLGLHLIRTRSLVGIQSLRRDLKNLDQYPGRIFEIEILSEFIQRGWAPEIYGTPDFRLCIEGRHVYAEARHRGITNGMALTNLIHLPFDADWHFLKILLNRIPEKEQDLLTIADSINKDLESILLGSKSEKALIDTADYTIRHLCEGPPRTVEISYGSHKSYSTELGHLTYGILRDKSDQIKTTATQGYPSIIIVDCRSLFWPESQMQTDVYTASRAELQSHILASGQRFLEETNWVSGIMWWWPQPHWSLSLYDLVHARPSMSITTVRQHISTMDAQAVAAALCPPD